MERHVTAATESHGSDDTFDIAVVGGGIAGLVAGLTSAESGVRTVIVDSHPLGGRARTSNRDGYLLNIGPHALFLRGHLQQFLTARGLSPSGNVPPGKRVRLLRHGQLQPMGLSPVGIVTTSVLRPRSKVRAASLFARLPRMKTDQFIGVPWQEFLGNEADDVAGLLATIVRTATYVNAPERFDTAAALDQLKLALAGVRYVDGGWQTIVDSLTAAFQARGGTVVSGEPVSSVAAGDAVKIETSRSTISAKAVVLAGLAPDAVGRIVNSDNRGQTGSTVRAAVLDLALNRVHDGAVFGIDEPLYLSPHGPAARLCPAGAGLVSLMRYVPDGDIIQAEPGDDLDRSRLVRLAEQVGITSGDIVDQRYLHRLVVAHGFPEAASGGIRGRPSIDSLGVDRVLVAGDWIGPNGQLADASSASGESAARRAIQLIAEHHSTHA